jgi:hypothetical protein
MKFRSKYVKRVETASYTAEGRAKTERQAQEWLRQAIEHGDTPVALVFADGRLLALERRPSDAFALAVVAEMAADALKHWAMENWKAGKEE